MYPESALAEARRRRDETRERERVVWKQGFWLGANCGFALALVIFALLLGLDALIH